MFGLKKIYLNSVFNRIPADDLWRLFIDGYRHQEGKGAFDVKEKGYMDAMLKAYSKMLEQIDKPLSSEIITELHGLALTGVQDTDNENAYSYRNSKPGSFGLVMQGDPLVPEGKSNVSLKGLTEFLNSGAMDETVGEDRKHRYEFGLMRSVKDKEYIAKPQISEQKITASDLQNKILKSRANLIICAEPASAIKSRVTERLKQYENAIKSASQGDRKLEAIITMIQDLARGHIFPDGNVRTLVMLCLNRELVKNGFKPTILYNPNRFEFYSIEELKSEIKNGQAMVEQLHRQSPQRSSLNIMSFFRREDPKESTQSTKEPPNPNRN